MVSEKEIKEFLKKGALISASINYTLEEIKKLQECIEVLKEMQEYYKKTALTDADYKNVGAHQSIATENIHKARREITKSYQEYIELKKKK